jgi:HEAT repeat protein
MMTSVAEWREFLQKWSDELLEADPRLPKTARRDRWLGYKPASASQLEQLEKRLGYRLPPSYRAFLLTTNGWRRTSTFIDRLRPAHKVEWLEVDDPQLLEAWTSGADEAVEPVSPSAYFAYDARVTFDDPEHFRQSLKIADSVEGDSAIYLLNPLAVAEDGEWEAWLHADWIPGAQRYPSFAHLMLAEYASFRATELGDTGATQVIGPFAGPYAPDRPRHPAERIGPGKRRARPLTVTELIANLEAPSAKARRAAAHKLFREFKPHDPNDERPELVEVLVRVLQSDLESEVRCAAALMLGSYGDASAVAPLAAAVADAPVADSAVSALHYLSIHMKDVRIADGMCAYLALPRYQTQTGVALRMLQDWRDERVGPIALRLLDEGSRWPAGVGAGVHDQVRVQAALALAALGSGSVSHLAARLSHPDAQVRSAAAIGLREIGDPSAIEPLRAILADPDAEVRTQAARSLRALGVEVPGIPEDPVTPTDIKELQALLLGLAGPAAEQAQEEMLAKLRAMGIQPP